MHLLLIRHAQPVRVAPGERGDGPADPPLTDEGRAQAERLAAWLEHDRLDAVYTSPLRRARETAEPLAARQGLELRVADDVAEYDAKANHYIPTEELTEQGGELFEAMIEGRWEVFGGDTPDEFRARVIPCMDEIIKAHYGGRVAVVCHGGVLNVYLAHLLGIDRLLWFDPVYTSISRVGASREGWTWVSSLNETAHLHGVRDLPVIP